MLKECLNVKAIFRKPDDSCIEKYILLKQTFVARTKVFFTVAFFTYLVGAAVALMFLPMLLLVLFTTIESDMAACASLVGGLLAKGALDLLRILVRHV